MKTSTILKKQTKQDNIENDDRKWITIEEFKALKKASKKTKHPLRNELIVTMLYRHGLRESELCNIKKNHLMIEEGKIFIKRLKNGINSTHFIEGEDLRLLRRYLTFREKNNLKEFPYLFVSQQRNKLSRCRVNEVLKKCSKIANIRHITPHMLRHGCGYYLANKGCDVRVIQEYLGHRRIDNTVLYTQLSTNKFEGLWD